MNTERYKTVPLQVFLIFTMLIGFSAFTLGGLVASELTRQFLIQACCQNGLVVNAFAWNLLDDLLPQYALFSIASLVSVTFLGITAAIAISGIVKKGP